MIGLQVVALAEIGTAILGCFLLGVIDLLDANVPNWRRW